MVINAPKLMVKGSGTITLACGACKVIIKSGGVYVEGASSLTIEGGTVLLDDVEPKGPQGLITGTAAVIRDTARVISASETGLVRSYAFAMIAGLAVAGVILAIVVAGVA